jgi:hypothetical protein
MFIGNRASIAGDASSDDDGDEKVQDPSQAQAEPGPGRLLSGRCPSAQLVGLEGPGRVLHFFVVDDSAMTRKMLTRILKSQNHQVPQRLPCPHTYPIITSTLVFKIVNSVMLRNDDDSAKKNYFYFYMLHIRRFVYFMYSLSYI